ncbi:MAG: SDR family NAD(P)-dependent oxidoreductase, partial [Thauera phenolivorans]|nr:SDR family NAD(P)-dependent oxidoreductase [Thauera phenolivorans]
MQNKRFDNKVAVITGAAQGIGRRVAERMASEGGRLVLVDRSELVHELKDELGGQTEVLTLTADLEQFDDCHRVMAEAKAHFGRIDILINNVGGTIWTKPYEHYKQNEIEAEVRRSLFPTLWCCHAVLPTMLEQQQGVIVNVSSIATRG